MEFFKKETHIDFMRLSRYAFVISVLMILGSCLTLYTKGLHYGLDFTGGTQLECRLNQPADLDVLRQTLEQAGYPARLAYFGDTQTISIRLPNLERPESENSLGREILKSLSAVAPGMTIRRVEFVGAEVGENLVEQGAMGILLAILGTMIYIAFRFEYRFAASAALALMHDPIVILGVFSLTQIEFDLASLAGILAVLGYSLNDTIVVYDRVRETFKKNRHPDAAHIVNLSINQTLSRTLMTSLMTLLVVIALLVMGGESLRGFSVALLVGIVVGTYSSIYVAGSLALRLGLKREHLIPPPPSSAYQV